MLYYKVLKDNNESLLIVSNYKMNYAFCMNINEIKHLHINNLKEPRISRFINNGISRNDLDMARNLVKKRKHEKGNIIE